VPLSFTVLPDGSGLVCPYPHFAGVACPSPRYLGWHDSRVT